MTLTAAARRLCDIAMLHFAEQGYDAASLNDIAILAGIRKASLYSHFAGKDALFTQVLSLSLQREMAHATASFEQAQDTSALPGGEYLADLPARFAASGELRLLLRSAYAPPTAVRAEVISVYQTFNEHLRNLFTDRLPASLAGDDALLLTEGYLGAIDAVQVELLYGEASAVDLRRKALWTLLISWFGSDRSMPR